MNSILKSTAVFITLANTSIAGVLNIVQLGPPDVTRIEINCGGASQTVDLRHGGTTGRFVLPEKEAVIGLPEQEISALTIPATASPNIAVLSGAAEDYRWTLIPGKPTEGKWSVRAINLSTESVNLAQEGDPLELKPGSTVDLPAQGKLGISVEIEGGLKLAYDGREPCAVLAIIHRKEDKWQVLFVPDR